MPQSPSLEPLTDTGPAVRLKLEASYGERAGTLFVFGGTRLRFGRAEGDNDLVLKAFPKVPMEAASLVHSRSKKVSSTHGELVVTRGGLALRDDASTGGTKLEGHVIPSEDLVEVPDRFFVELAEVLGIRGEVLRASQDPAKVEGVHMVRTRDGDHSYLLLVGSVTIGSGEGDALCMDHPDVKPGHARLSFHKGAISISALRGDAPVTVRGARIPEGSSVDISRGAEVALGGQALQFKPVEDADMGPNLPEDPSPRRPVVRASDLEHRALPARGAESDPEPLEVPWGWVAGGVAMAGLALLVWLSLSYSSLRTQYDFALEELNDASTDLRTTQGELGTVRDALEVSQQDAVGVRALYDDAESRYLATRSRLEQSQRDLETVRRVRAELGEALDDLTAQLGRFEADLQESRREVRELTSERDAILQSAEIAQAELADTRHALAQRQSSLEQAQSQLSERTQALARAQEASEQLQAQLDGALAQSDRDHEALAAARAERDRLAEALADAQARLEEATAATARTAEALKAAEERAQRPRSVALEVRSTEVDGRLVVLLGVAWAEASALFATEEPASLWLETEGAGALEVRSDRVAQPPEGWAELASEEAWVTGTLEGGPQLFPLLPEVLQSMAQTGEGGWLVFRVVAADEAAWTVQRARLVALP